MLIYLENRGRRLKPTWCWSPFRPICPRYEAPYYYSIYPILPHYLKLLPILLIGVLGDQLGLRGIVQQLGRLVLLTDSSQLSRFLARYSIWAFTDDLSSAQSNWIRADSSGVLSASNPIAYSTPDCIPERPRTFQSSSFYYFF